MTLDKEERLDDIRKFDERMKRARRRRAQAQSPAPQTSEIQDRIGQRIQERRNGG